jgi:hypothetical protein
MFGTDERVVWEMESWARAFFVPHEWGRSQRDHKSRYFYVDWNAICGSSKEMKGVINAMAKRNSTRNAATAGSRSDRPVRWVNAALTDDLKAHIVDTDYADKDALVDFLALLLVASSLTVKTMFDTQDYMACAMFPDPDVPTGLVGLSAFAPTAILAVKAVLCKWYDVLGEQLPPPAGGASGGIR